MQRGCARGRASATIEERRHAKRERRHEKKRREGKFADRGVTAGEQFGG